MLQKYHKIVTPGPSWPSDSRSHDIVGTHNHKRVMGWETNSLSNILPIIHFLYDVFESPWLEVSQQGEV